MDNHGIYIPNGGRCVGKVEVFEKYFPAILSNFEEFHAIADEYLDVENDNALIIGRYFIISKKNIRVRNPIYSYIHYKKRKDT